MIVLPQKKLDWMYISSIYVSSCWRLLSMMMFVDVSIHRLNVKCPVEKSVEEIKDNKKWGNCQERISERNRLKRPNDVRFVKKIFCKEVGKGKCRNLGESNESNIYRFQVIKMFATHRNLLQIKCTCKIDTASKLVNGLG